MRRFATRNERPGSWRRIYGPARLALLLIAFTLALPAAASALTSGGSSGWTEQSSGTLSTLWSVDFIDASRGWAVGDNGTIIATTNGGATWSPQNSGVSWYLDGVCFVDAMHGWAVGALGTILVTSNGGASWTEQDSGTIVDLNAVAFTDVSHGWAVGNGGMLCETTNGGATWTASASGPTTENLNAIAFSPDGSAGTIAGDNGAIFHYAPVAAAAGHVTTSGQFRLVSGSTARAASSSNLYAAALADASHRWVAGASGTILFSSGTSWSSRSSGVTANLRGMAFPDASHGWAVGDGWFNWSGTVVATTDGGATWSDQSQAISTPLNGVAFADAAHGWAVGNSGAVFATVTGGVAAPTVAGFAPTSGPVGSRVTLSGTDFVGASKVAFHGTAATSFAVVSATQITVSVPPGATTGPIAVTTPGGTGVSTGSFTITSKPAITRLSPTSAKRGATVTITGKGFGAKRGKSVVKFGTKTCAKYVSWSATRIKCKVPATTKIGRQKAKVVTAGGASNAKVFTVKR